MTINTYMYASERTIGGSVLHLVSNTEDSSDCRNIRNIPSTILVHKCSDYKPGHSLVDLDID